MYFFYFINTNIFNDIINYRFKNKIPSKEELSSFATYMSLNKTVNKNNMFPVVMKEEKEEPLIIQKENPIIYIYNTHDTEKYNSIFISDYSIIPDVKIASHILKDHLNDLGINSYVEERSIKTYLNKHKLSYSGSYEASRTYLLDSKKKNNYEYYIDIHRDSAKYNKTLWKKDNKKYARIMFVLTTKHKNYKENKKFVNELNNMINKKYTGLSRGIYVRNDVIFNQDISDKAILIELGGVDNTLEEINNTLEVFSKIFSEFINEEKK
ncbi:MAG: stage II sporulation protein P [Bacilli bacterium]|nr:stage II sporulation protein P [Bacilli bacterium]